jgi:6-phosphogluconolactonase/glucosamine-6-phosphate isomerase/deaminase
MINYRKTDNIHPAAEYLAGEIRKRLEKNQKVLWLLSGGSAIKVAIAAADHLSPVPEGLLTITLADERYGPVGHADSNWLQLEADGLALEGANLLPVLHGNGLEQTARDYAELFKTEIAKADFVIALAGMGPDGHIFGIKPGRPSVASKEPVVGYEWEDYDRLTPTFSILKQLDEVVVYAAGPEKHRQLEDLEKDLPPEKQPAQLLKQLENVTIFNDLKGESS